MEKSVKFDKLTHLSEISSWALERGLPEISEDMLPQLGRIIPGKCALFIYQTDSKVGYIENLISKPGKDSEMSAAITSCIMEIEQDAKHAGIKYLLGSSALTSVINRATTHGYQIQSGPYQLISKRL